MISELYISQDGSQVSSKAVHISDKAVEEETGHPPRRAPLQGTHQTWQECIVLCFVQVDLTKPAGLHLLALQL